MTTVIEADYSGALTLLLRYPVPEQPSGPQSFAEDALYLRRHLTEEGGRHIILKYSANSESASIRSSNSRRGKRVASRQHRPRRSISPRISPGKFLQEHGGIEGIIQEAAKGVSNRGEKWGVSRALRGAYEGLQSAGSTPQRLGVAARWPLNPSNVGTDEMANLTAKIQNLEQRNVGLAKLLEKAMEDLWIQQRELTEETPNHAIDALSLAIAKVQFVQVYLENPTMLLPAEEAPRDFIKDPALQLVTTADLGSPSRRNAHAQSPTRRAPVKEGRRKTKLDGQEASLPISPRSPSKPVTASGTPVGSIPSLDLPQNDTDSNVPPRSRPALAQSSFSWMLGQEQRISEFVAASPFSTEQDRGRGRAGFLFGDEEAGDGKESSPVRKAKKGEQEGKEGNENLEEAITLADMASGRDKN